MPKRAPAGSGYIRITGLVPNELAIQVEETRAKLRAHGVRASTSAIIEIALRELLSKADLAAILRRHGAKARRG